MNANSSMPTGKRDRGGVHAPQWHRRKKAVGLLLLHLCVSVFIGGPCMTFASNGETPATQVRPTSLTASVGDVLVRIDGPKLWTLSRIEYKQVILGVEDSAYGSVVT